MMGYEQFNVNHTHVQHQQLSALNIQMLISD